MPGQLAKFLAAGIFLSAAPAVAQPLPAENRPVNARASAHMGEIDTRNMEIYQKQMQAALSMTDTRRRDAAVTAARQQLAQNIHKPLTPGTIAELDGLLDLGGASPQLGATG